MPADKDIDHLRQHDGDEAGGRGGQVGRIQRIADHGNLAVLPAAGTEDEEEGRHGPQCLERAEEQVGARQQMP